MSAATPFAPIRNSRPLLILLIGVAIGNLPLFSAHLLNLWKQPQYQYFPIVLAVIGWLLWRSATWRETQAKSRFSLPLGTLAIATSLSIAVAGTWIMSPWIATFSLVIGFAGLLLVLHRWLYIENPVGIWCLSLLVLKPPVGLDTKLAFWLQGVTSRVSGALLDMTGVVNLVEGNTIVLEARHLFVEQACSGIVSLMSIIACCAIIAVWQNRPAPHAILLTISGAFWACILNIFRITVMAIALDAFGIDMTEGWKHEALGLVLFTGTLGLSFCTDRFLLFFLTPIMAPETQLYGTYTVEQTQHPLSRLWNYMVQPRLLFASSTPEPDEDFEDKVPSKSALPRPRVPAWTIALGVLFIAVGVTQAVRGALKTDDFQRVEPTAAAMAINADVLPANFCGMKQIEFETVKRKVIDEFGERSHQWTFASDGHSQLLSMDFVFSSWHDVTLCYEGLGWQVVDRKVLNRPGKNQKFIKALFSKDDGQRAMLIFGTFDSVGNHVAAPEASLTRSLMGRFEKERGIAGGVYQTQTFIVMPNDIPTEFQSTGAETYYKFYDQMANVIGRK
jgi:exosortase